MKNTRKIIVISLLLLIMTFLLSSCGSSKSPTGDVIKETNLVNQKCKIVEIPYDTPESYLESEPYQAIEEYQVDLKYEVIKTSSEETYHSFDAWATGKVTIRNVDSESGLFTVEQTFKTLNRNSETKMVSTYIMPGEEKDFISEIDIDLGEDFNANYKVTPPKKTLSKTVTKYRDVTKYRTVTKYKSEEVCVDVS